MDLKNRILRLSPRLKLKQGQPSRGILQTIPSLRSRNLFYVSDNTVESCSSHVSSDHVPDRCHIKKEIALRPCWAASNVLTMPMAVSAVSLPLLPIYQDLYFPIKWMRELSSLKQWRRRRRAVAASFVICIMAISLYTISRSLTWSRRSTVHAMTMVVRK